MSDDNIISWNLRWGHPSLQRRQICQEMVLDHCHRVHGDLLRLRVKLYSDPVWDRGYDVCYKPLGMDVWGVRHRVELWAKYYRYEKLPALRANDA